jgi:hypothetical protein
MGPSQKALDSGNPKKQEAAFALLLRLSLSLREVGVVKTQSRQNIQIWYYFVHQASFAIRDLLLPQENFQGVAMHSNDYTTPSQWKGKHGIIVGTANTGTFSAPYGLYMADHAAHDVAEDMIDAGLSSVTMIQRNKTCMYNTNKGLDFTLANAIRCPPSGVLPARC